MPNPRRTEAINVSEHYIRNDLTFPVYLNGVDAYISGRGDEDLMRLYRIDSRCVRSTSVSSPLPDWPFYKGHHPPSAAAPITSNTTAKCELDMSDWLDPNLYPKAGKRRVPSTVYYSCNIAPEKLTSVPRREVMVYPRRIDRENTEKLRHMECAPVAESNAELICKLEECRS